jgi:hypothetical protein
VRYFVWKIGENQELFSRSPRVRKVTKSGMARDMLRNCTSRDHGYFPEKFEKETSIIKTTGEFFSGYLALRKVVKN